MNDEQLTFHDPVTIADLPAIVALLADDPLGASRERPSLPLDPAYVRAFEGILTDRNQVLYVARRAGRVIGCLQLTIIPGLSRGGMLRGQIKGVRVARSERGEGIGQTMIRHAIDECRRRGCGLVQLTTDKARPDARRFYESLGFVSSHEGMKLPLV